MTFLSLMVAAHTSGTSKLLWMVMFAGRIITNGLSVTTPMRRANCRRDGEAEVCRSRMRRDVKAHAVGRSDVRSRKSPRARG